MMEQNKQTNLPISVPASKRFISALIDYIPVMMIGLIASIIGLVMFFQSFQPEMYANQSAMTEEEALAVLSTLFSSMTKIILPATIGMAFSYTYFLCKDLVGGRSPGKRMQKLQLVRLDGSPVSYNRMILRNIFLIIWPVELIMYLANSGQRLGDILCNTTVVAATEDNKQPVDMQKVTISVIVVFICSSLISICYYRALESFFDWYIGFLEGIMQQSMIHV